MGSNARITRSSARATSQVDTQESDLKAEPGNAVAGASAAAAAAAANEADVNDTNDNKVKKQVAIKGKTKTEPDNEADESAYDSAHEKVEEAKPKKKAKAAKKKDIPLDPATLRNIRLKLGLGDRDLLFMRALMRNMDGGRPNTNWADVAARRGLQSAAEAVQMFDHLSLKLCWKRGPDDDLSDHRDVWDDETTLPKPSVNDQLFIHAIWDCMTGRPNLCWTDVATTYVHTSDKKQSAEKFRVEAGKYHWPKFQTKPGPAGGVKKRASRPQGQQRAQGSDDEVKPAKVAKKKTSKAADKQIEDAIQNGSSDALVLSGSRGPSAAAAAPAAGNSVKKSSRTTRTPFPGLGKFSLERKRGADDDDDDDDIEQGPPAKRARIADSAASDSTSGTSNTFEEFQLNFVNLVNGSEHDAPAPAPARVAGDAQVIDDSSDEESGNEIEEYEQVIIVDEPVDVKVAYMRDLTAANLADIYDAELKRNPACDPVDMPMSEADYTDETSRSSSSSSQLTANDDADPSSREDEKPLADRLNDPAAIEQFLSVWKPSMPAIVAL